MVIVRPEAPRGEGESVVAPGEVFVAFNPGTCAVQKVWRGGMNFRGKVWDFSQDNCAPANAAVMYAQAVSTLVSLPDSPGATGGWTLNGLDGPSEPGADQGWVFTRPDSSLISPEFDAAGWQRVMVAFDETQRNGPFRVDVSDDGGTTWVAKSFFSTTHGSSDEDWQFDFKLVERPGPRMRVRWTLGPHAADKRIRRVHVFGDRLPWRIAEGTRIVTPTPIWRGYERHDGSAAGPVCTLMFDLRLNDGRAVSVRQSIGSAADNPSAVVEEFQVTGLPAQSTLRLDLPELAAGEVGGNATRTVRRPGATETALGADASVSVLADEHGSAAFTITTSRKEHP